MTILLLCVAFGDFSLNADEASVWAPDLSWVDARRALPGVEPVVFANDVYKFPAGLRRRALPIWRASEERLSRARALEVINFPPSDIWTEYRRACEREAWVWYHLYVLETYRRSGQYGWMLGQLEHLKVYLGEEAYALGALPDAPVLPVTE